MFLSYTEKKQGGEIDFACLKNPLKNDENDANRCFRFLARGMCLTVRRMASCVAAAVKNIVERFRRSAFG